LKAEHWTYLLENGLKAYTRPTVEKDPVKMAKEALEWLEERVEVVLVHFDVDVVDSGEFPLGNFPHYAGLGVEEAMACLGVFLGSLRLKGVVVTEVNPNNDPEGGMVRRLVDGIVEGLRGRVKGASADEREG
jgi:arginase